MILDSPAQLDLALAKYFDNLYFEGYTSLCGEKVAAAVMFAVPSMSKHGDHCLVRARRSLRGWSRLAPGRQRLPPPCPCLMAPVGSLCAEKNFWVAVALVVGFVCYLRPGELDQLTHRQLIGPTPGAGPLYQKWGLLLHPSSEMRFGKTAAQDEGVLLDRCEWLFPRLAQLAQMRRPPLERPWPFPTGTLQREFSRLVAHLRLGPPGSVLVQPPPRRSVGRLNLPAPNFSRNKTQRPMEERGQPCPLRQRDPSPLGVEEGPSADFGIRASGREAHRAHSQRSEGSAPAATKSSEASPALSLGREFRAALRSAARKEYRVVLELFAGSGGISRAVQRQGHAALPLDIVRSPTHDLTDPIVLSRNEGWLASGCVSAVWLAKPCSSWRRARRGPPGSRWAPLRDATHILGVPNLSEADRAGVKVGHRLARATARIIRRAVVHGVPTFLENPHSPLLWRAPQMSRVLSDPLSQFPVLDQCQVGARWRKRTCVAAWHAQHAPPFERCCHGRAGICSRTHRRHIVLQGRDYSSGRLWTHIAQAYPARMCALAADWLLHSATSRKLQTRQRLDEDFEGGLLPGMPTGVYGHVCSRAVAEGAARPAPYPPPALARSLTKESLARRVAHYGNSSNGIDEGSKGPHTLVLWRAGSSAPTLPPALVRHPPEGHVCSRAVASLVDGAARPAPYPPPALARSLTKESMARRVAHNVYIFIC